MMDYLRNSLLLFLLMTFIMKACGNQYGKSEKTNAKDRNLPEGGNPSGRSNPIQIPKLDLSGLSNLTIEIKNESIGNNITWLRQLGIDTSSTGKKHVIVNAQNTDISFGGGGINGAITGYVRSQECQTEWKNLKKSDGVKDPVTVPAGQYAVSDFNYGYIYHAVGPKNNTSWTKASLESNLIQPLENLVYDMLYKAKNDNIKIFVLCALSTAIFSGSGKDYSEEEFIAAAYEGHIRGIKKFNNQGDSKNMKIILNKWDKNYYTP